MISEPSRKGEGIGSLHLSTPSLVKLKRFSVITKAFRIGPTSTFANSSAVADPVFGI